MMGGGILVERGSGIVSPADNLWQGRPTFSELSIRTVGQDAVKVSLIRT